MNPLPAVDRIRETYQISSTKSAARCCHTRTVVKGSPGVESILKRVPGLTEWMDWIDCRGLKKAAVTNAPAENARVMLLALGMDKWFDEIILGENCKMPKPHPDPYLDAIKVLGVKREEALICEDSPSGAKIPPPSLFRLLACPQGRDSPPPALLISPSLACSGGSRLNKQQDAIGASHFSGPHW